MRPKGGLRGTRCNLQVSACGQCSEHGRIFQEVQFFLAMAGDGFGCGLKVEHGGRQTPR